MNKLGTRQQDNNVVFVGLAEETYPGGSATGGIRKMYHNGALVLRQVHVVSGIEHEVLEHYHNGELVFSAGEVEPPETPLPADNIVTITNPTESTVTNAPIRIGQQFKEGAVTAFPTGRINGVIFETQANVKTRWNDNSVKHAIISFILPSIAAGESIEIDFVSTTSGNNVPLTKTEMLDSRFDFDAVFDIDLYDGNTPSISARTMLNADHYELWNEGQVATTVILRDYTPAKTYAIGHDSNVSLWPAFEVTFWNDIDTVEVRFVMESPDTEAVQDESYDISLKMGDATPTEVYTKSEHYHRAFARWTKKFWSNTQVDLDRDIGFAQNIEANAFPNYDMSIVIAEEDIVSYYDGWLLEDTDIGDAGKWTTRMGNAGGREEIGPITVWNIRWLYDGDHRHREVALKQCDLAGNWPMNYREGKEGYFFDLNGTIDNYGKNISINPLGRTGYLSTFGGMDGNSVLEEYKINKLQTCIHDVTYFAYRFDTVISIDIGTPIKYTAADESEIETTVKAVIETGNHFIISFNANLDPVIGETFEMDIGSGWEASGTDFLTERLTLWATDGAHYPNYSHAVYFVEGDYYYFEQLLNDANLLIGVGNPQSTTILGRGRTSADGRLPGTQTRGLAWIYNIRMHAEDIIPDDHYCKPYITRLNRNAIAFLAGEVARSNPFPNDTDLTDMFNHGLTEILPTRFPDAGSAGPLGSARDGGYAIYEDRFYTDLVSGVTAPWQHHFLTITLGRAKELGHEVDELLLYFSRHLHTIWDYTEAEISRYIVGAYVFAVLDENQNWFANKKEVYDVYLPSYVAELEAGTIAATSKTISAGQRYELRARSTASYLTGIQNWPNMWSWLEDNINNKPGFLVNPQYALNPREPVEIPTEPPVEFNGLQTFVDTMSTGEWKQIPGTQPTTSINGFRTITEINAIVDENPGCAPMWGQAGSSSLLGAEGGAAWDGQKMYFTGGGHFDYGGNEIYAFNFAADVLTLGWERISEPYPLIVDWPYVEMVVDNETVPANDPPVPSTCKLPSDGPSPAHTWNKWCYNPENNSLMLMGGDFIGYCADYYHAKTGRNLMWEFMLDTGSWRSFPSAKTTFLDSPNDVGSTVYYPPLKQMIHWPRQSWGSDRPGPSAYDVNGNIQRERIENSSVGGIRLLTYNPNDGFVYFADSKENRMMKWDPSTDPLTEDTISLALAPQELLNQNPDPAFPWYEGGFALNEVDNTILMWAGNRSTWLYDITYDTWTEYVNLAGADPTTDEKHIYSKWVYIPEVDVYVGCAEGREDLWVYKLDSPTTVDFAFTEIPELFVVSSYSEDQQLGIFTLDFDNLWPQGISRHDVNGWIPSETVTLVHESGDDLALLGITYDSTTGIMSYDGSVVTSHKTGVYRLQKDTLKSQSFNIRILVPDLTWGTGGDITPAMDTLRNTMQQELRNTNHFVFGIMPDTYLDESIGWPNNSAEMPDDHVYIVGLGARHNVKFTYSSDDDIVNFTANRHSYVSIKNLDVYGSKGWNFGWWIKGINLQDIYLKNIEVNTNNGNGIIYNPQKESVTGTPTLNSYFTDIEVLKAGEDGYQHNLYIENRQSYNEYDALAVFNCIKSYACRKGQSLKCISKKMFLYNSYLATADFNNINIEQLSGNDLLNFASAGWATIFNNHFKAAQRDNSTGGSIGTERFIQWPARLDSIRSNDDPSPESPNFMMHEYYDDIRSLGTRSLENKYLFQKCLAFNKFEYVIPEGNNFIEKARGFLDMGTYPLAKEDSVAPKYYYQVPRPIDDKIGWLERGITFFANNDFSSTWGELSNGFTSEEVWNGISIGTDVTEDSELTTEEAALIPSDFPRTCVDMGGNIFEGSEVTRLTELPTSFNFSTLEMKEKEVFTPSWMPDQYHSCELWQLGVAGQNVMNDVQDAANNLGTNDNDGIYSFSGAVQGNNGYGLGQYAYIYGGGHAAYSGNELLTFGPLSGPGSSSPKWHEFIKPSPSSEVPLNGDGLAYGEAYYNDGRRAAIHSYQSICFAKDRIHIIGGSGFFQVAGDPLLPLDYADQTCVASTVNTKLSSSPFTWGTIGFSAEDDFENKPLTGTGTKYGSTFYDKVTDTIFYLCKEGVIRLTPGELTYQSDTTYPSGSTYGGGSEKTIAYDQVKQRGLMWPSPSEPDRLPVKILCDETGLVSCLEITFTGDLPDLTINKTPIVYDSINDLYWLWSGNDINALWKIDYDANTIIKIPFTSPYDPGGLENVGTEYMRDTTIGIYGRFQYVEALGGCILINNNNGPVWFYKT